MQLPLIVPNSNWKPPRIADLPDWGDAKRVAIDIETRDPKLKELGPGVRRGAHIVGYSFAIEDTQHKYYIPLRHDGGDNVEDVEQALGYLREQAAKFKGEICGANLGYDYDFLLEARIDFPNIKRFRDVQILEPLLDDLALSYSLETLSNKYLGMGKSESLLREAAISYGIDPKKDMWRLPARFVGQYAEADATLPLQILRRQEREAEEQDLFKIYDMESDLLPVLVRMRRRGVRIDLKKLEYIENWSAEEEKKALEVVKHLTGSIIPFNGIWRAESLVASLKYIGCQIPLTPKTKKPSISKDFLKTIIDPTTKTLHPVAEAIQRARKVNKVRTTFCESVRHHMTNGKIHCIINQLRSSDEEDDEESGEGKGARYGRCSSTNPNLQQQPARDPEIGDMWRSVYLAEEGELWCSADFSSQEPRQAVHYAVSTKLGKTKIRTPEGFEFVDADKSALELAERYRNDPNTDPHTMMAQIAGIPRKPAKDLFLGKCYGMGASKLCRTLGLPTIMAVRDNLTNINYDATSDEGKRLISKGQRIFEAAGAEGQKIIDEFELRVPWVSVLSRVCTNAASKNGYIRTMAGRKCRFPKDAFGNYDWVFKSLNRLIQGSSADQTKMSLLALDKAGIYQTLVVHDEVCASIKNENESNLIVEIMENAYKLEVPNKLTKKVGISWGEAIAQ